MSLLSSQRPSLALSAVAPVLLASLASAQELELPRQARAQEHVLHLADGRVLRVRARPVDSGWEIARGRDWTTLPSELVDRATPSATLLKEARRLERDLDRDDHARRAMYAGWLLDQGLWKEGLQSLDRVLEASPDQEEAVRVITQAALPVELPPVERLEAFLIRSAKSTPSVREVAVQRLAAETDEAQRSLLVERLEQDLVNRDPRVRSFATLVLRRLAPNTLLPSLYRRALLDVNAEVRRGAALALGAANDDGLVAPMVRELSSKHAPVRVHAAQALGHMNYAASVEPLVHHLAALQSSGSGPIAPRSHAAFLRQSAYVQDFDVEVAQGQAIADPIINVLSEGAVLEAAVISVQETRVQERSAVRSSLERLTGAQPGNTKRAWEKWWNEHGEAWKTSVSSQRLPTSPSRRDL